MKLSGIVKIDIQHQMLFNAIKDARNQVSRDSVLTLLHKMESYIALHFSDEEQFMRDNNVLGYDEHLIQHSKFKSLVRLHIEEVDKIGVLSSEILKFAEDWLINHINVEAELFRQYVKH